MTKRGDGMQKLGREVSPEKAQRGCIDKRRFRSKTVARDQAIAISKRSGDKMMRAYRCGLCAGWHLTSAEPWGLSRRPEEAKRA